MELNYSPVSYYVMRKVRWVQRHLCNSSCWVFSSQSIVWGSFSVKFCQIKKKQQKSSDDLTMYRVCSAPAFHQRVTLVSELKGTNRLQGSSFQNW